MTTNIPLSVRRYLRTISRQGDTFDFIQIDSDNRVVSTGSNLAEFDVGYFDPSSPIDEQFPPLAGLLPVTGESIIVIANAQFGAIKYVDLHLYSDSEYQWLLLFDNTVAGTSLQLDQQVRLGGDIAKEGKSRPIKKFKICSS